MVKSFPSFQFDLLRKIMFYQLTLNFVQNLEDSLTSQCPNTSLSLAQQPSLLSASSHSFCPGVSCCLRYKVLPTKSLLILPHSSKVLVILPQSLVLRQQRAQKAKTRMLINLFSPRFHQYFFVLCLPATKSIEFSAV